MISIVHNDKVNWVLEQIISGQEGDHSIVRLNPVIAGGSILSIYRLVTMYDAAGRWPLLKRLVSNNFKKSGLNFTDIDIWFLEDNPIYSIDNKFNFLISDYEKSLPGHEHPFAAAPQLRMKKLGLSHIKDTSYWANTFLSTKNGSNRSGPFCQFYQFIKKQHKSVEDILNTFDFVNCMIAWYKGVLYIDSRLEPSFDSLSLALNTHDQYHGSSLAKKVFNALRAFKYSKRYHLDFGASLSKYIFQTYSDACSVNLDDYQEKVEFLEKIYGARISQKDTLRDMIASLMLEFRTFCSMRTFRPEYAVYLINYSDSLRGLKEYIGDTDRLKSYEWAVVEGLLDG